MTGTPRERLKKRSPSFRLVKTGVFRVGLPGERGLVAVCTHPLIQTRHTRTHPKQAQLHPNIYKKQERTKHTETQKLLHTKEKHATHTKKGTKHKHNTREQQKNTQRPCRCTPENDSDQCRAALEGRRPRQSQQR